MLILPIPYNYIKGRCHGNHFCLRIYGVYIGAAWKIRLNRPCAAALRPHVKLLWSFLYLVKLVKFSFLRNLFSFILMNRLLSFPSLGSFDNVNSAPWLTGACIDQGTWRSIYRPHVRCRQHLQYSGRKLIYIVTHFTVSRGGGGRLSRPMRSLCPETDCRLVYILHCMPSLRFDPRISCTPQLDILPVSSRIKSKRLSTTADFAPGATWRVAVNNSLN